MASDKQFTYPVRVQWEDTDAGGVVYHANYIKFMERARSEAIRSLGLSQTEMAADGVIVVVDLSISFRRPAVLENELVVRSRLVRMRHATCELEQDIWRGEELLTEGAVRCAFVDPASKAPRPFPKPFYNAMLPELTEPLHAHRQALK